ncbi:glutamate receptor ionotropic, kainate 1-like [Tachypleus tridentatus]|uniref:glutamate receptor ionotropic, kainate 1-like n=1 Tax=Tachypleus tridentatus TaxID=6853 RepID=UPI003FD58987
MNKLELAVHRYLAPQRRKSLGILKELVIKTLHQSGTLVSIYNTNQIRLLAPPDHTALYSPNHRVVLWIVNDLRSSASVLQQLKDHLVLSIKSKLIILSSGNISQEILDVVTEGDKVLYIDSSHMFNTTSVYINIRSLRWTSKGKAFFKSVCPRSTSSAFMWQSVQMFSSTRNFKGRTFSVSYPVSSKEYGQLAIEVLEILSKHYHFKFKDAEPLAQTFGVRLDNGSWTGLMKQLHGKETDIGATLLSWTVERERAVDFTLTILTDDITFLLNAPSTSKRFDAILRLFKLELWLLYITLAVVIGACTTVSWIFSQQYCQENSEHKCSCKWEIADWSFWSALKGLVWQDPEKTPNFTAPRIILGSWWFVTLLVLSVYIGNIRAFLNVKTAEEPIDSVEEALEKDIHLLFNPYSSTSDFLKYSPNEVYKKAWKNNIERNIKQWSSEENVILNKVLRGSAFISERSYSLKFQQGYNNSDVCPFYMSSEQISKVYTCIGLQKSSPLRNVLNEGIKRLKSAGLIEYLRKKMFTKQTISKDLCTPAVSSLQENNELLPLTLNNVGVTFIILLTGYFVSTAVFYVECTVYNRRKKKTK